MQNFLEQWDTAYQAALRKIDLFDVTQTARWSKEQRQLFIKLLYHQRGHFDDILWFMGNFAPDAESKELVLQNISEEFGQHAPSHEKLYLNFAKSHGVDLMYELIEEAYYLPFLRDYNRGHLAWLRKNDWNHRIAAFAAIERLDNLDYPALKDIAISIGTSNHALIFFNAHVHVTHYDSIEKSKFSCLWTEKSLIITEVFSFIADYQVAIWKKISDYVFSYTKEKIT